MSDQEIPPQEPRWTRTEYSYSHTTASASDMPAFPPPGMSVLTMVDDPTEDVASEKFFAEFANWYASSYRCRSCPRHLYKTVLPEGHEFEIATDDPVNSRVGIKRLFSCAHCKRFVTTAASEDDVARATEHAVRTGGTVAAGLLGDTNNFEFECGSMAEYRDLLQTTDAIGTKVGRRDAGFIRLGAARRGEQRAAQSVADSDKDFLDASVPASILPIPVAGGSTSGFEGASTRRRDASMMLLGGLAVLAVGAASAFAIGVLPLEPDDGQSTYQQSSSSRRRRR